MTNPTIYLPKPRDRHYIFSRFLKFLRYFSLLAEELIVRVKVVSSLLLSKIGFDNDNFFRVIPLVPAKRQIFVYQQVVNSATGNFTAVKRFITLTYFCKLIN